MPQSSSVREIWPHLILASVVLLVGIWCSSGTLAPYASTHYQPTVLEPCGYLANLDNGNFLGTFLFLDGKPKETWVWSVYLRRILYPLLSYPLMKGYGFLVGGFLTNLLINLGSLLLFGFWLLRRYGVLSAKTGIWLLCTYPGISYWAGLPYNQVMIVPCSLLCLMLLFGMAESKAWLPTFCGCLLIGILCLGYDLLPYFGPAAILVVMLTKRFGWLLSPVVVCLLIAPLGAVLAIEYYGYGIGLSNANNDQYKAILDAYLYSVDYDSWAKLIKELPDIAWHTYLYSNFIFLPLLFGVCLILASLSGVKPGLVEVVVLISIAAVFLFNNLAPPYEGWQMRGDWIPRIYQPIFVVFISYVARVVGSGHLDLRLRPIILLLVFGTVLSNTAIIFGPIAEYPALADHVYFNFYRHSYPGILTKNLETYGRRPIGFCTKQKSVRQP